MVRYCAAISQYSRSVLAQANEDKNLYTFDMRKLEKALCIHQDHVMAV